MRLVSNSVSRGFSTLRRDDGTKMLTGHVPAMYSLDCGVAVVALRNSSDKNCTTLSGVNESPSAGIFAPAAVQVQEREGGNAREA